MHMASPITPFRLCISSPVTFVIDKPNSVELRECTLAFWVGDKLQKSNIFGKYNIVSLSVINLLKLCILLYDCEERPCRCWWIWGRPELTSCPWYKLILRNLCCPQGTLYKFKTTDLTSLSLSWFFSEPRIILLSLSNSWDCFEKVLWTLKCYLYVSYYYVSLLMCIYAYIV